MNCQDALPLIHGHLDGDLSVAETIKLKEHIHSCSTCRHEFELLEHAEAIARTLPGVKPSDDLMDRIMLALPTRKTRGRFNTWLKHHPAITAASVFFFVMFGSFLSMWNDDKEMVVKGADLDQVVIHGDTVTVPAGHRVNGNLVVQRGTLVVEGEVTGNLVVIDGSYNLASTAKISGQIRQVDQALEWLWYKVGEMASTVSP